MPEHPGLAGISSNRRPCASQEFAYLPDHPRRVRLVAGRHTACMLLHERTKARQRDKRRENIVRRRRIAQNGRNDTNERHREAFHHRFVIPGATAKRGMADGTKRALWTCRMVGKAGWTTSLTGNCCTIPCCLLFVREINQSQGVGGMALERHRGSREADKVHTTRASHLRGWA